jgi:hypothetical protein
LGATALGVALPDRMDPEKTAPGRGSKRRSDTGRQPGCERLPWSRAEHLVKGAQFERFGGPEVLEIVDLPNPVPGQGEIRIAVRAAGVNASDWKKRQGLMD